MHVMVLTYGEPKRGYLNFTLGNLWATQPIVLLNLATLGMALLILTLAKSSKRPYDPDPINYLIKGPLRSENNNP